MSDVRCIVSIDGEGVNFTHLTIDQSCGAHHNFELLIALSGAGNLSLLQRAKSWLGKHFRAELAYANMNALLQGALGDGNIFDGVIKGLAQSRGQDGQHILVVTGQGLSALADSSPHTRSFTESGLAEIVDTVLADYQDQLAPSDDQKPIVSPQFSGTIPYVVQYKESDFDFINRLASEYGEWFYYNGQALHLDKPSDADPILLTFGTEDLYSYELSLRTFPVTFTYNGYDYLKHDFPEQEPTDPGTLGPYADVAFQKSQNTLYANGNSRHTPIIRATDQDELKRLANRRQQMRVHEMVSLRGSSGNPGIKVGSPVGLTDGNTNDDHGVYIVTSVRHSCGSEGEGYTNTFEAIPKEATAPPVFFPVDPPFCEAQQAMVVDTNDPEGLGRVQVEFFWQQGTGETSPWIRVATFGMGGKKGFFQIPEKDDVVWVDFEHHDPDFPYVLAGFFHGQAKPPWQDPKNNVKAWVTRSGNTVTLSDESGKETITIANPDNKNSIILSLDGPYIAIATEGNLSISAKENVEIIGKQIAILAEKNLVLESEVSELSGTKSCDVKGGEVTVTAGQGKNTTVGGMQVAVNGQTEVSVAAMAIKLNS